MHEQGEVGRRVASVTGANGDVGHIVVPEFARRGDSVALLARGFWLAVVGLAVAVGRKGGRS